MKTALDQDIFFTPAAFLVKVSPLPIWLIDSSSRRITGNYNTTKTGDTYEAANPKHCDRALTFIDV